MEIYWQTSKRRISLEKTLVMAILNVTPDSFSDGGKFLTVENALKQAELLIEQGADILDIGGESTRPNSERITVEEEIRRVIPVIEKIAENFDVAISIDTTKSEVASRAIKTGAEIINDISGLRFDERIADIAAETNAGLVLMYSRGDFETMHKQPPIENVLPEVEADFRRSIETAKKIGVKKENIALDVGIGFGKTQAQNLKLIAKLGEIAGKFPEFPLLVGASRKSFIGKILGVDAASERLQGSLANAAIAVWNGAKIVRVHDVRETVETLKMVEAIKQQI